MIRLVLVFLFCIGCLSHQGCSSESVDLSESVTESDIEEYERLIAESEKNGDEE